MATPLEEVLLSRGWGRRRPPADYAPYPGTLKLFACIDSAGQDRLRLIRYALNDLPAGERDACKHHLARCAGCRDYLARHPQTIELFRRYATPEAK